MGALPEALDDSEERTARLLVRVSTEDESLASAEKLTSADLALLALEPESDLLRLLCLFPEDGLGLTTIAGLLGSVTTCTLGLLRVLALLVLRNLEFPVPLAHLAVRVLLLWSMHLSPESDPRGSERVSQAAANATSI